MVFVVYLNKQKFKKRALKTIIIATFLVFSFMSILHSQPLENSAIIEKISSYKIDQKGPYQQIMWFCPDGSMVAPRLRCPEPGGVQRAMYKPWVEELAKKNNIYLGQILAATDFGDFLDEKNQYSRLKQYQIENYLENIDKGWIQQKAKYYRGAFQDEDENAWGEKFLPWMLTNTKLEITGFYLLRQTFKDIPHKTDNANIRNVRALSKEIADSFPGFMNLRIKIHGQPGVEDIESLNNFKLKFEQQLNTENKEKLEQLIREMEMMFQPVNWKVLESYSKKVGVNSTAGKIIRLKSEQINRATISNDKVLFASELLLEIRKIIPQTSIKAKVELIDLSNKTEELMFRELTNWNATTLGEILQKNYVLAMAAAGAGYLEIWEWEKMETELNPANFTEINIEQLNEFLFVARRIVEWSTGMIRANFGNEIKLFEGFEPMVSGFSDDLIRSSMLLPLGQSIGELGDFITKNSGASNRVFSLENQSQFRGLNPGFAKGELVVADDSEGIEVSANKIYIFQHAPADLKPVAGIATVSEGNLVSHVQLLARNLGIPNAVLSSQSMEDLKKFAGKQIFYAVSEKGTVVMKLAENMNSEEKALFENKKRVENKIRVEINKLDLNQKKVLDLQQVNATSSGKICGPKAANLGQLKLMFPENVVEGLVIPFGIFKQHMELQMPGENQSYWTFLNNVFVTARQMEKSGKSKDEIDNFVLQKLQVLSEAIQNISFLPEFVDDLKTQFRLILGKEMGSLPVFLRSDTNMEDLKDFTGAGLNLTLFNVVDTAKILQGIKKVWASPYSERSFRWRQSYLLNPENVFPSILVIPSVDVDYSGVLITKGVGSGEAEDLTLAFSRGAGGAVDGQAAESYLLKASGKNILLAPSREAKFNTLPLSGGTGQKAATFERPILSTENLSEVRNFSKNLKIKMEETDGMEGPFDVEFGFQNNKLWLFQVRPFVENKNAAGATYLESITPKTDNKKTFLLSEKIVQ